MIRITWQRSAALAGLALPALLLVGCGEKAPPAPLPPPPPPVVVAVPLRPTPPDHASPLLAVPPVDAAGLHYSVNRNITPAQTLWNLRAAYNVAALNCPEPKFGEIVVNYRGFLKAHAKTLAAANKKVDAEYRARYGAGFVVPREKYMTEVYNHFALPPTLNSFCTAVLAVSRDALPLKSAELEAFAARSLPNIEVVFDDFYRRYAAYRLALAEWTARHGPPPIPVNLAPVQAPGGTSAVMPVGPAGR